jgi:hypothetical protein
MVNRTAAYSDKFGDSALTVTLTRERVELNQAERYRFETDGFVVVPDLVPLAVVEECRHVLDRMAAERQSDARIGMKLDQAHYLHFGPMLEYDPLWLRMLRERTITGIVEELVGGPIRFCEIEGIINRRPADAAIEDFRKRSWNVMSPGFHRGIRADINIRERDGRRYFNWVKALVMLTDIGPDDGGTLVIRGSHYSSMPKKEMIAVAEEQPELVAQATGTAGSVLFLCESAVHSTSMILSDRERRMLVMGYGPTWAQCWPLHEPSGQYVAAQEPGDRDFLLGGQRYWGANPLA